MSFSQIVTDTLAQLHTLPAQNLPNPPPRAPLGSGAIENIVGYIKWIAGICTVGLFFGGIIAATAGRLWDHHGSGRLGARLIVGSLALALLFGIGYPFINQLASGGA